MLHPPRENDWERILVMGGTGTGKTTAWLNIAKWLVETKSPAKFHVIDTDRTVTRSLSGGYSAISNSLNLYPVIDFDQYDEAAQDIVRKAGPDDWIIVDMIGSAWQAAQDFCIEQVYGTDPGQFLLEARKNMKVSRSGKEFFSPFEDARVDWRVINGVYNSFIKRILFRSRSHVLCCTSSDAINRDTDSESAIQLYGRFGVKPTGQKNLGFQFSTILCTEQTHKGYNLTTIKDRERKVLIHEPVEDFTETYLLDVAGWEL